MKFTKGHTNYVYQGLWHPIEHQKFLTISFDGTIRIWDLNSKPIGL